MMVVENEDDSNNGGWRIAKNIFFFFTPEWHLCNLTMRDKYLFVHYNTSDKVYLDILVKVQNSWPCVDPRTLRESQARLVTKLKLLN